MIDRISVEGVKGITRTIRPTKRVVVLGGAVGAGKSTFIEALRLAMRHPTKFGDKNLDMLSPTGVWSVGFSTTEPAQMFRRALRKSGSVFEYGGKVVTAEAYKDAIRALVDLDPHHIDLSAFVDLSGGKRSELLAKLLSVEKFTPAEVLSLYLGCSLSDWLSPRCGADSADILPHVEASIPKEPGTPAEILEAWRASVNEINRKARDQEAQVRALEAKATIPGSVTKAELQTKLGEASEAVGTVKAKISEAADRQKATVAAREVAANTDRRRSESETRVTRMRDAVTALTAEIETAKKTRAGLTTIQTSAQSALDRANASLRSKQDDLAKARAEIAALQRSTGSSSVLVPDDKALVDIRKESGVDLPIAQVGSVVTAAFNWRQRAVQVALAGYEAVARRLEGEITTVNASVHTANQSLSETQRQITQCERTLAKPLDDKTAELAREEATLSQLNADSTRLAAEAQATVWTNDLEALGVELKTAEDAARACRDRLDEYDQALIIAGQIDSARLQAMCLQSAARLVKEIADIIQGWRDAKMQEKAASMLAPLEERLRLVLDNPGVKVEIETSGQGPSAICRIYICWGAKKVPLETLSTGQSVLVGAAFLAALQSLKQTRRILTMDTEALDGPSFMDLLKAVPKLGFDFVLIANNRATAGEVAECPDIEFINLGSAA